jgi:hypothetical protein
MSWFKKALGAAVTLGTMAVFGCSGQNQLVGSDGLTVAANNGGNGSTPSSAAPVSNASFTLEQLTVDIPEDPSLCLPPIQLILDATGNADCIVVSARHSQDCNCAAAGFSPTSATIARGVRVASKKGGQCDGTAPYPCDDLCVCELDPAVGASLKACQTEAEPNSSTSGWCYVSAAGGAAQNALVEQCPENAKHRLRFFGPAISTEPDGWLLGCNFRKLVEPLGAPCISDDERRPNFAGHSASEVSIDDHAASCSTGMCIQNHFQGRVSCPFGQTQGGQDCLVDGGYDLVTVPVKPQLIARSERNASICSCQCAGSGPGPYCTCPESMQCEHLIDDLGIGTSLAGSYCIPKGSQYDPQADAEL